jgi:hypothetical protein
MSRSDDRRRWPRVLQINAGYIHEALEVFGSVESKYCKDEFFQKAVSLSRPTKEIGKRRKRMMKVLRDSGFHLDKADSLTTKTLAKMKATDYILFSGDDGTVGILHFDFADEVDLISWAESFRSSPGQTHLDILMEIAEAMKDYMSEVIFAADALLQGLLLRLDFSLTQVGPSGTRRKIRTKHK